MMWRLSSAAGERVGLQSIVGGAESPPPVTAVTARLKIAGGDADLDNFLALTRSNEQDLRAMVLSMKAKALTRAVENELIYGDVDDIKPKGFDGLHEILGVVTGAQDGLG